MILIWKVGTYKSVFIFQNQTYGSKVLRIGIRCYLSQNTYIYIYRAFSKIQLAVPAYAVLVYLQSIFQKDSELYTHIKNFRGIYSLQIINTHLQMGSFLKNALFINQHSMLAQLGVFLKMICICTRCKYFVANNT